METNITRLEDARAQLEKWKGEPVFRNSRNRPYRFLAIYAEALLLVWELTAGGVGKRRLSQIKRRHKMLDVGTDDEPGLAKWEGSRLLLSKENKTAHTTARWAVDFLSVVLDDVKIR